MSEQSLKKEIKAIIIQDLTKDLETEEQKNKEKILDLETEILKQEKVLLSPGRE